MTLYQFKLLDEHQQAEALWERGVYLDTRSTIFHTAALYQMDGFYVEVYYHREENKIVQPRSLLSTIPLEPYLAKMDVRNIIE